MNADFRELMQKSYNWRTIDQRVTQHRHIRRVNCRKPRRFLRNCPPGSPPLACGRRERGDAPRLKRPAQIERARACNNLQRFRALLERSGDRREQRAGDPAHLRARGGAGDRASRAGDFGRETAPLLYTIGWSSDLWDAAAAVDVKPTKSPGPRKAGRGNLDG